jgi:phytoene dehydrogenase-like protein
MDHEAIVVGGGHNGLICAAYLARAGVETLVLEARPTVGGCASTVDALGARVNICTCDHSVFRTTPIAEELGLGDHGLTYLDVDPPQQNISYSGGPAWTIFHDLERTLESLRRSYPWEVEGYQRYAADALPVAELVLELANLPPRPGGVLQAVADRRARGVATLLRWSRMSAGKVLRRYFRDEAVSAPAVVVGPAVWGAAPSTPGTGLGVLVYANKHVAKVGRPVGGSGALPSALLAALEQAGGKVRCDSEVVAIHCEGERVRGVELADGTRLDAPIVVSAADPRRTFVSWLRDPPASANRMIERWRSSPRRDGYESKLDAVVAEPPRFQQVDAATAEALGYDPLVPTTIVSPSLGAIDDAHRAMARGAVAGCPMLFANTPSVLDPTLVVPDGDAGAGGHVFSLEVLYTPYELASTWVDSREPLRWLELCSMLVQTGWIEGLRRYRAMTPPVYERDFHLPRGYATSFAGGPLAALRGDPRELTRYETPVKGLYLTGAATFPGAGVWGASGRNAARVILGA